MKFKRPHYRPVRFVDKRPEGGGYPADPRPAMNKYLFKKTLIIVHDLVATAVAVIVDLRVRFDGALLDERVQLPADLPAALRRPSPASSTGSSTSTGPSGASRRCRICSTSSAPRPCWRWRCWSSTTFSSRRSSSASSSSARSPSRSTGSMQMFLLGGPRLAFRYMKYRPLAPHPAARRQHADAAARPRQRHRGDPARDRDRHGEEAAARGHPVVPRRRSRPVDPRRAGARHLRRSRSGRAGFPGARHRRSAASSRRPSALAPEANPDMLIARARRLGLPLVRVTSLGEGMRDAELAPLEIEDLLLRPTGADRPDAAREFHPRQARSRHRRRRLDRLARSAPASSPSGRASSDARKLRAVPAPYPRKPDARCRATPRWTA